MPGKLFGNLFVPSEGAFRYIQELECNFLAVVETVAHKKSVCAVLFQSVSGVGSFHLCSEPCSRKFLHVLQSESSLTCSFHEQKF